MKYSIKILWFVFAFFAIGVGLYPLLYFVMDESQGLLSHKTPEVLESMVWNTAFRLHIFLGGLSLLTGWSQFSKKIRTRRLSLHRTLGKIYVAAVFISGSAALYIAFYATGGIIAQWGFGMLAVSWLFTTYMAFSKIRSMQIDAHQEWMIRSYSLAFAAVTLRIYLPFTQAVMGMTFIDAYVIIAWLCWVPNLVVAEMIISRRRKLIAA
ncbi:MAG: hypothetical protein DHS20C17_06430 [Cyclobacteriaceae bacterium]|nr:MAG: hypothetical protein DHS20C17_06430 [Cyclobacteriaceae bacterium]